MRKQIESLDEAARRLAGGHYVTQSIPGANPERDKAVSEAIAQMKAKRETNKVR